MSAELIEPQPNSRLAFLYAVPIAILGGLIGGVLVGTVAADLLGVKVRVMRTGSGP